MSSFTGSAIIPAEAPPSASRWRINHLEMGPPNYFLVVVESDIGTQQRIRFSPETGSMALNFINTADFSPPRRSFAQRVLDYVVNNGYISGSTVTESLAE